MPFQLKFTSMANSSMSSIPLATESYLLVFPQGDGKLPIWLIFVAAMAMFNTVQNFFTLQLTRRLYNNINPVTHPGNPYTFAIRCLEANPILCSSHTIACPYVRRLDVDRVCCAFVCCLQHSQ
jgi:hypothetical protein